MTTADILGRLARRFPAPWRLVVTTCALEFARNGAVEPDASAAADIDAGELGRGIAQALPALAGQAGYDGGAVDVYYLGFGESIRFRYDLKTREGISAWSRKTEGEITAVGRGSEVKVETVTKGLSAGSAALLLRPVALEEQLNSALKQAGVAIRCLLPLPLCQLNRDECSPGVNILDAHGCCSVVIASSRGTEVQFAWPNTVHDSELPSSWYSLAERAGAPPEVSRRSWQATSNLPELVSVPVRDKVTLLNSVACQLLDRTERSKRAGLIANAALLAGLVLLVTLSYKSEGRHASLESERQQSLKQASQVVREMGRFERWAAATASEQPVSPLLAAAGEAVPEELSFTTIRQTSLAPVTLLVDGRSPRAGEVRRWLNDLPGQRWPARGKLIQISPPPLNQPEQLEFEVLLEAVE